MNLKTIADDEKQIHKYLCMRDKFNRLAITVRELHPEDRQPQ